MSQNPRMGAAQRVIWRQVTQAAHEAARDPEAIGKAKALNKALAGSGEWMLPDLRPLPAACFRAFLTLARGWAPETDAGVRAALAPQLIVLADAAGDILDGVLTGAGEPPAWTERADLR